MTSPSSQRPSWIDEALAEHDEHGHDENHGHEGQVSDREQQVLDRIDKARRRRPKVREERITMSHGAGGKATHTLIEAVFLDAFRNPLLEPLEDAATLQAGSARVALTTDSYVVSPLFFPGGDIGELAVNGTVNDLAVSGATPRYLSAGFLLEEGFPVADLNRIAESMRDAAVAAGVQIVTGDTKVVQRGKADGCYINTAGVGVFERGPARPKNSNPSSTTSASRAWPPLCLTTISPAASSAWRSSPRARSTPAPRPSTSSSPTSKPQSSPATPKSSSTSSASNPPSPKPKPASKP